MEFWKPILDFPSYSVSSYGRVMNHETEHVLAKLVNQYNVAYVCMMSNGVQHKRSLARLVAQAFVPHEDGQDAKIFDTPINLDGDRLNNDILNLDWRPRWFAIKYHKQFINPVPGLVGRILDVDSKTFFNSSWHIATTFGLLEIHVRAAIESGDEVWPTRQRFILLPIDTR
jgi:hypothetical protein